MSAAQHGHGADDGAVHAHISSVPFYVAVFLGALAILAGFEGALDQIAFIVVRQVFAGRRIVRHGRKQ